MSINYSILAHFSHFRHFRHSSNYNIFPDKQIMQNKANFRNDKIDINSFAISKYEILSAWWGQKTNPIQTQLKPKQTQFKANKAKNKANSNPILKPLIGPKLLQAQSAKMAQKLTSSNHQNNTREKYNSLSINMLNSLSQHNPPTGTSFAYLRPEKMKLLRKEYSYV